MKIRIWNKHPQSTFEACFTSPHFLSYWMARTGRGRHNKRKVGEEKGKMGSEWKSGLCHCGRRMVTWRLKKKKKAEWGDKARIRGEE